MSNIIWEWCDKCKRPTNHIIHFKNKVHTKDEDECIKCCNDEARRVNCGKKI